MIKKILVFILALTFVFSAVGCGSEESEFIEYNVTQTSENSTVAYDQKSLNTTVIEFSKAEPTEKLFYTFGENETGKSDVNYLGRVRIIDGNVVIGLKVGDKPRMAGVYVKGIGYYFIKGELTKGEYAISIKNVPFGTYQLCAFGIIEDYVILNSEFLSFNKEKALLLQGESEGEFTLEYGNFSLDAQKYVSQTEETFAVAKNSILNFGEITATIQGDAGITLGVYGYATGVIANASYVYAGIYKGKAVVMEPNLDKLNNSSKYLVLGEAEISNYNFDTEYAVKVNVVNDSVGQDAERKTKVVLTVNGEQILTVDKTIEENRNVGFMCLSLSSSIGELSIPSFSLDEYKSYAKSQLENLVCAQLYVERINGLYTSYVETKTVRYDQEFDSIKTEYDNGVTAIDNASDIQSATTAYNEYYKSLDEEVTEVYKDDVLESLANMPENWYSIVDLEGDLTAYPEIDTHGDNKLDVVIKYLSGAEEGFNIGLDALDTQTWDRRWWIPIPLRTPTILISARKEIDNCTSKDALTIMYEEYYDALLRSVCQKVIEEYHAIKHIEADGFLWAYNWNYCGDNQGGIYTFEYSGPVTEYKGVRYGISNETQFRLSPLLYHPEEGAKGVIAGDKSIHAFFNYAMSKFQYATVTDANRAQ